MRFATPTALLLLTLPVAYLLYCRWRRTSRRSPSAAARPARNASLSVAVYALLTLALADPQMRVGRGGVSAVFVLDRSASISSRHEEAALDYLRRAGESMSEADRAAVAVFAQGVLVEQALQPHLRLDRVDSTPAAGETDIASALRLAAGLADGQPGPRIVLLSDGNETVGDAVAEARLARVRGVPVDVVPLGSEPAEAGEVSVSDLITPRRVRVGEPFEIEVAVDGPAGAEVELTLYREARELEVRRVKLTGDGEARPTYAGRLDTTGMHLLTVEARSAGDRGAGNNRAGAVVQALGRPRVLYLTGRAGVGLLPEILVDRGFAVTVGGAELLGTSTEVLEPYDTVVLDDLTAVAVREEEAAALAAWVAERGGGLLMLGAGASFGPGGWGGTAVEEVLPVEMRARSRGAGRDLALVLALDKSGSMAADESGLTKLAAAKDAAATLLEQLDDDDQMGVIVFDREAVSLTGPGGRIRPRELRRLFADVTAGGGTSVDAALLRAYDWLSRTAAARKHVLLLSDGRSDPSLLERVRRRAAGSGVELSAVAFGPDADHQLLSQLVEIGGGKLYRAEEAQELEELFRLEGRRIAGDWLVERSFRPRVGAPHEILTAEEVDGEMPLMSGYVSSLERPDASVVLRSDLGEPILACWQHGLGRSLAFTSQPVSAWGGDLIEWEGFADLWERMVRWTGRRLSAETMHPRLTLAGDRVMVEVDVVTRDGRYRNGLDLRARVSLPNGAVRDLRLPQVAPGRYGGSVEQAGRGTYLMTVNEARPDGGGDAASLGLYVATLPEDRLTGLDRARLGEIARQGGGALLELEESPFGDAEVAFRDVWGWLAAASLLPFLVEIGRRRRRGLPG